jgi:hypothetical protein
MTVDDHDDTTGEGFITHVCADTYNGRVERRGFTTITTTDNAATARIEFVQLPRPLYIEFDQALYTIGADGGSVHITGRTNAASIAFTSGEASSLPTYFSAETESGTQLTNLNPSATTFADDPGKDEEIAFAIDIAVDSNSVLLSRSIPLTVAVEGTSQDSTSAQVQIVQSAGASYINLTSSHTSTATVVFAADGTIEGETSVDIDIYSNDNWTVTVEETENQEAEEAE